MASDLKLNNLYISNDNLRNSLEMAAKELNEEVQKILTLGMRSLSDGSFCIATTGSDARHEKLSRLSPVELMIIIDEAIATTATASQPTTPRRQELEAAVKKIGLQFSKFFDSRTQIQNLHSNPLTYHAVSKMGVPLHLTIPNRAVEATLLFGSEEVMTKYKKLTLQSLKAFNHPRMSHFDHQFYNKALAAMEICYKREDKKSVDLDTGELNYDHDQLKSVKYTFMRIVQYELIKCLIKTVKQDLIDEETFSQIPPRIDDRIRWMQENKLLPISKQEAEKLSSAYEKALEWYLNSQREFEKGITKTFVDIHELNKVATTIHTFIHTQKKPYTEHN